MTKQEWKEKQQALGGEKGPGAVASQGSGPKQRKAPSKSKAQPSEKENLPQNNANASVPQEKTTDIAEKGSKNGNKTLVSQREEKGKKDAAAQKNKNGRVVREIDLPKEAVGMVIGKKGVVLKALKQKNKVSIIVAAEPSEVWPVFSMPPLAILCVVTLKCSHLISFAPFDRTTPR